MSQLIAMFCDIDDFCKWFEPLYMQRLLQSSQCQRVRPSQLTLSEILTILVYFHSSHYRDFKHYYTEYVTTRLRPYFPALVSYSRFVELLPRALVPLCGYLHTRKGRCTGVTFVDSTSLAVCHNRRISRHKVFEGYATRGKSSMGWYFGFKLHLMVNDEGELLAFRVTTAEVNDQEPVGPALWGPGLYLLGPPAGAVGPRANVDHSPPTQHEAPPHAAVGPAAAAEALSNRNGEPLLSGETDCAYAAKGMS